jgi:hypothetical protein
MRLIVALRRRTANPVLMAGKIFGAGLSCAVVALSVNISLALRAG